MNDAIEQGHELGYALGFELGRILGRALGYHEGWIEGWLIGKRDSLRMIVQARFGTIPEVLEQRIVAADAATLDALISRAAVAKAVDALLEGR